MTLTNAKSLALAPVDDLVPYIQTAANLRVLSADEGGRWLKAALPAIWSS